MNAANVEVLAFAVLMIILCATATAAMLWLDKKIWGNPKKKKRNFKI